MVVGVYVLRLSNGMRYVGSSTKSISGRIYKHRWSLERGWHSNYVMQTDYDQLVDKTITVTAHACLAENCRALEQKKLDYWKARKLCYNMQPSAFSTKGFRCSERRRSKVTETMRAKGINL